MIWEKSKVGMHFKRLPFIGISPFVSSEVWLVQKILQGDGNIKGKQYWATRNCTGKGYLEYFEIQEKQFQVSWNIYW